MPKDLAPARLSVSIGQRSDKGARPENQDFHGALLAEGAALIHKGIAIAIADGISTSPSARAAAETAVGALMTDYYSTPDAWTVRHSASRVIEAANGWMFGRNRGLEDIDRGMVCTLSALILKGREGHVLHVGDSRVSRLEGESFERLTEDHAAAGDGALTRAMGAAPTVEIDCRRVDLHVGDLFVLTTDGVHAHLSARDVARAVAEEADLDAAATRLVQQARACGSADNLTIQLVRIDALPPADGGLGAEMMRLPVPRPMAPGQEIDGFRILRELHAAARSHVYLARAPGGGTVALKIPSTEHARDEDYLRRFVFEEWIARRLNSPHVLRPAGQVATRSALYVVSEHLSGVTLRQWMTDHPRPGLDEVRAIAGQLVKGLRALHRRDMIHQDLRPENVMIDADGVVTIIDLGSCAVAGVEEAAPGVLGEMPGTFQYTAPEYMSGEPASWRSDQYALAVIVYEMLTGRLPYGAQVARVRSRRDQARLRYIPARDEASGVPAWIDAALRRALHPDPLRRYDALSEFETDLRRPGPTAQAARPVPLMERDPLRFWQGAAALLALLSVILALRPWE